LYEDGTIVLLPNPVKTAKRCLPN